MAHTPLSGHLRPPYVILDIGGDLDHGSARRAFSKSSTGLRLRERAQGVRTNSMRRDFQIALVLGIAAMPAGVAVSEAIEYFPYLKEHPGLSFWGSAIVTLALFALAAGLAIRGEREAEREEGAKKRMIPLIGMILCGLGFVAFGGWYFWPSATIVLTEPDRHPAAPKEASPSIPMPGPSNYKTETTHESKPLTHYSIDQSTVNDPTKKSIVETPIPKNIAKSSGADRPNVLSFFVDDALYMVSSGGLRWRLACPSIVPARRNSRYYFCAL